MAVRALGALMAIVVLAAASAAPAGAETGTLAIGVPPNPIRLAPATITFGGTVDEPGLVYARSSNDSSCGERPDGSYKQLLPADGQPVGPGPFSIDVAHLLGSSFPFQQRELICAWLVSGKGYPVLAAASAEPALRRPAATVRVSAPVMDRGVPATVTVSGTVEAPRRLDVVLEGYCTTDDEEGPRGAGVDSAANGDYPRLTPPDGVMVGPGPFSVGIPWTPGALGSPENLCTYLSAPNELAFPETRLLTFIDWALPWVVVTSPADGASGELLNPVFSWERSRSRRQAVSDDVFELSRIEGDRRLPLARISGSSWRPLSRHAQTYLGQSRGGRTSEIASRKGASLAMLYGIWPGTYEWTVARAEHRPSAPRRFTVVARPLRQLKVKTGWDVDERGMRPSSFTFDITGVEFATYRREWRVAGGSWRATQWTTGRWARTDDLIETSCRRPGGIVDWRLTARDALGTVRTRSGRFANVPAADCAQMRRNAAFARRYQRACRSIGGRPIQRANGYWICRTPPGTPKQRLPGF